MKVVWWCPRAMAEGGWGGGQQVPWLVARGPWQKEGRGTTCMERVGEGTEEQRDVMLS